MNIGPHHSSVRKTGGSFVAFMVLGMLGAGPSARACGPELSLDTSLYYDFGVSPSELSWLEDADALEGIERKENHPWSMRMALARARLWEPILRYRAVSGGDGVEIPLTSGRWRWGRVTHPQSGSTYDVVHWHDIDDGSYTLYFRRGTPWLCQLAYEN